MARKPTSTTRAIVLARDRRRRRLRAGARLGRAATVRVGACEAMDGGYVVAMIRL
jgi:hypothetical protein